MKKLIIAAIAAAALSPAALAQTDFRISGGYSAFDGDDATLGAITARGTLFFSDYIGAEVEGHFGVSGEEIAGIDLDLDNAFAGYAVARYPAAENFEVFGRVGYGTATISGSIPGIGSADVDVDGFSYGIGAQYFFTPSIGVRGDITRFEVSDDDIDGGLDIYSISAVYRFGAK